MLRQKDPEKLLEGLRVEATEARACFRTLAAQAMLFAAFAIGGILAVMERAEITALAAVGVMIVVMGVQRIGIHKFSTSNRIYAYQLHLERLDNTDFAKLATSIGWEEACRAWRIVQAAVFAAIYREPDRRIRGYSFIADLIPWYYRSKPEYTPQNDGNARTEFWWLQKARITGSRSRYHAGGYLERMFGVLEVLEVFCLLPLGIFVWRRAMEHNYGWSSSFAFVVLVCAVCVLLLNHKSLRRRRELLEDELLSIHSSAIMWKAVVLAHQRAWGPTKAEKREYTERLSRVSCWLAGWPKKIREMTDAEEFPLWFATDTPDPTNPDPNEQKLLKWLARKANDRTPKSARRKVRRK